MRNKWFFVIMSSLIFSSIAEASVAGIPGLTVSTNSSGGETYTLSLQILLLMTGLTLLPGLVMAMTSFTRIIIVLSILRQAMGLAQTPTNQILIGITLFMTFFIMSPVIEKINSQAIQPYINGKLTSDRAMELAQAPLKGFMLNQTRTTDIKLFMELSGKNYSSANDLPMHLILPAFITSELKTAFQIGFIIFLPFLIIDMVVASVLMSMGMMMLSPLIVSLPFKIMMFVLIDGWTLLLGTLASSFSMS